MLSGTCLSFLSQELGVSVFLVCWNFKMQCLFNTAIQLIKNFGLFLYIY